MEDFYYFFNHNQQEFLMIRDLVLSTQASILIIFF